jgi:hypothetical protein
VRLAHLEDKTHAAASDELDDLKLRKCLGAEFDRRDFAGSGGRDTLLGGGGGAQQNALATQSLRRFRRSRRAAFGMGPHFGAVAPDPAFLSRA